MTDLDSCDWTIEPDFRTVCKKPAVQWIVHTEGGNLNVHCSFHAVEMHQEVIDEGWLSLTREEAAILDIMNS